MKKLRSFLTNIIKADTPESSKRLISLFTMILITYIVVRFTNEENVVYILGTLCGFVLALLGVAAWEGIKKHKKNNNEGL